MSFDDQVLDFAVYSKRQSVEECLMKKRNVLLCLWILVAPIVSSANEVRRWHITPQAGGLIADDDRNIEDGDRLFGLSIGRHLAEQWSLELNANGAKLDSYEPYAGSLDLLRVFRRNELLSPYLTMGAGAIRNDVDSARDDTDFMTQASVGLMWKLGDNRRGTSFFALRPEVKARWDDAGRESFIDYIATLGFQFLVWSNSYCNNAAADASACSGANSDSSATTTTSCNRCAVRLRS